MIQSNPHCELSALCDIGDPSMLGIEKFEVPFYRELGELLNGDTTFDVLNICTPNGLHHEHAMQGLDSNKHLVIEKPMTLNAKDAQEIIALSKEKNKEVFCVMQNRYSPPISWLKDLLDQDKLGNIYLVKIDCYWNRDDRYYLPKGIQHPWHGNKELDGGVLYTQFSHFIDLMYWLFGDVKNIQSKFANFSHQHSTAFEDSGSVSFDFIDGGMGSINYSTSVYDKNFESSITILGSNGTIKIGGQYMNELIYCHVNNYEAPELAKSNAANDYGDYKGSANNHPYVFENIVDVLLNGKEMTTRVEEGMKVVDIIERFYREKQGNRVG